MDKIVTQKQKADDAEQRILSDFLSCQTVCADLGTVSTHKPDYSAAEVGYLVENLPGLSYVLERMINYIFSNGLTTGSESGDAKLDEWLFEQKNLYGATNYAVLRDVISNAIIYGECGLRMYEKNIYAVISGHYKALVSTDNGIEEVVGYFMRKDGKEIDADFDYKDWSELYEYGDIQDYFNEQGMILMSLDEFINVRNDTSSLHGYSPLLRDKQRIALLMSVYERLNYDINYDGPGRIIVRPKDGFIRGEENDVSTGEIIANSVVAQEQRIEEAKKEIRRVGEQIKKSGSDSVIMLSNAFDKEVEHLPRVTKATEFFGWLESDTVILAQILGMSPTLVEVGKLHGNVSVEKIIDNAMLNTIIPLRESYATQFSKMIADRIGEQKVYFDKYDMEQVQDENDARLKVAQIIKDLAVAQKASPSDDVQKLIDEFSQVLRSSVYNEEGDLREM